MAKFNPSSESCEMLLHGRCINITRQTQPRVYICAFCADTPNAHVGRGRDMKRAATTAAARWIALSAGDRGRLGTVTWKSRTFQASAMTARPGEV